MFVCSIVATVAVESVASPPNEGDGTGVAALLRLTTSPTTAILAGNVALSVSVMAGGSATGKLRMGIGLKASRPVLITSIIMFSCRRRNRFYTGHHNSRLWSWPGR